MNFENFLKQREAGGEPSKSGLWVDFTLRLQKAYAPVSRGNRQTWLQALEKMDRTLHYGFYTERSSKNLEKKITKASTLRKEAAATLKKTCFCDQRDAENAAAFVFLHAEGLFDAYLELARSWHVVPDMPSARHFYYAYRIKSLLKEKGLGRARVLEIGAGAGNLSLFLRHLGVVVDYTIIDLPEMLIMAGVYLEGEQSCRFLEFPSQIPGDSATHLLSAGQNLDRIPSQIFNLVINVNSFSEMPILEVNRYLEMIYRVARPGAIFFNVNRIQKHIQPDGSVFDMNPLLFPYRTTDKIVIWDVDPFQQFVAQFGRAKIPKSTAILRVATV